VNSVVVDPDVLRIADLGTDAFQGLQDILAAVGEVRIGGRAMPGVGIDDGQATESAMSSSFSEFVLPMLRPGSSW
jgi:hypothetical protein